MNQKKKTIIFIQFVIIFLFLLIPRISSGNLKILYQSYYADVFIPFGYYFLIFLSKKASSILNTSVKKALSVFLLCATSETLQYFGIYALARTFDPIDYLMYALGVLLAIIFEKTVFKKANFS